MQILQNIYNWAFVRLDNGSSSIIELQICMEVIS